MVTDEAEKALEERDRELQKRHEQWCTNYCMNKCKARKDCSGQPNAECGEYMARMDEEIKFKVAACILAILAIAGLFLLLVWSAPRQSPAARQNRRCPKSAYYVSIVDTVYIVQ